MTTRPEITYQDLFNVIFQIKRHGRSHDDTLLSLCRPKPFRLGEKFVTLKHVRKACRKSARAADAAIGHVGGSGV